MGFVKTLEEIAEIQSALSHARFPGTMLSVEFRTREEIVRRLLPPPLEPAAEPIAMVGIERRHGNVCGDFNGGVAALRARYGDIEGLYVLWMAYDSEAAVIWGRDFEGSPKKLCEATSLVVDGDHASGWLERHGVRLIEIEATLTSELRSFLMKDIGPEPTVRMTGFNYKASPTVAGGLEDDAILTLGEADVTIRYGRDGDGTVRLCGTVHDPLDQLEVVEVLRTSYSDAEVAVAGIRAIARVPAKEFLPYAYGRADFWPAFDTIAPDRKAVRG